MSRKKLVDAIDIQMLNILQKDGRIKTKELANEIGLSEGPTSRRLRNLISRKIIKRFTATINHQPFGFNFQIILIVKLIPEKVRWFVSILEERLKVLYVYELARKDLGYSKHAQIFIHVLAHDKDQFKDSIRDFVFKSYVLVDLEYYEITSVIYDNPFISLTVDDQF